MTRVLLLSLVLTACPPPGAPQDDTEPPTSFDPDDRDGDGYSVADGDCDDQDASVHPEALEIPYDGADQDCDGEDSLDGDGDGFDALWFGGDDCDDEAPDVHPGAEEICGDGVDSDCSGDPDDGATDADGDSWVSWACTGGEDCDDDDAQVHPGMSVRVPEDYGDVAEAVAAVCSGSTVTVAEGRYRGEIDGRGKAIRLVAEAGAERTVLEGEGGGSVVVLGAAGGESLLSGFTVTGGAASWGGGVLCTGLCTIEDSIFEGNSASYGGGVALLDAELSVASCSFLDNDATEGAGLYIQGGGGSVSDVDFSGMRASAGGGGASVWYASVDFTGIRASELVASQGGGIFLYLSDGTVRDSTFDTCSAEIGGAVWSREAELRLSSNSFLSNHSAWGGAGYYCWDSEVSELDSNTFEGSTLEDTSSPDSVTTPDGVVDEYDCDDYTTTPCVDVGCRSCYGCP
jgi:hypothetical protein